MVKKCGRQGRAPRRHPAGTREAVEKAVREEGATVAEVARRLGVSPVTARGWVSQSRQRPMPAMGPDPEGWGSAVRAAAARIHDNPTVAAGDWALVLGWPPAAASTLARRCGFPPRRPRARRGPGWEAAELARRLRRHLAQRIAALDAELDDPASERDTAKVLRDLGGLKRLLDELGDEGGRDGRTRPVDGVADPRPSEPGDDADLPALRAAIARRLAADAGDGPA